MPSYHIAMGQALVLNNLIGNEIYTGPPPAGNALQSCSAVILVNPAVGCGAMYHYPANAFENNALAQNIIRDLANDVNPTEAWLYYGNVPGMGDTGAYAISNFLLGIVPQVKNRKASTGAVSVTIDAAGQTQIDTQHMDCAINLTHAQAGAKAYGHLYM